MYHMLRGEQVTGDPGGGAPSYFEATSTTIDTPSAGDLGSRGLGRIYPSSLVEYAGLAIRAVSQRD